MDKTTLQDQAKQTLLARYEAWLSGYVAGGGVVHALSTPCCGKALEVPAPKDVREQWDSLMVCPYCEELFMKVARYDEARGLIV